MFIKKDLRKIATILDDAVDCNTYEKENNEDNENENNEAKKNDHDNKNNKIKRLKREEPLTVLRLGRRKQEFNGTVQVLCAPTHIPKLKFLHTINLYECNISNLNGFGPMFHVASPNLETINLGRNPIETMPDDFAEVSPSLKHLWLDDCSLSGEFPRPLLLLKNLVTLRLPNNNITHLNIGGIDTNKNKGYDDNDHNGGGGSSSKVIPLENLKTLCLDRNKLGGGDTFKVSDQRIGTGTEEKIIDVDVDVDVDVDSNDDDDNNDDDGKKEKEKEEQQQQLEQDSSSSDSVLPSNLAEWLPNLEGLLLRHNQFTKLGVTIWPTTLQVLHISSNQLSNLNEIMGIMVTMENDNDTSMDDDDDDNDDTAAAVLQPSNFTHLYANGNQLQCIPTNILTKHPKLQRFVISHNPPLKELSNEIWKHINDNDNANGEDNDNDNTNNDAKSSSSSCKILWKPNPNLSPPGTKNSSSSSNNDDRDGDGEDEDEVDDDNDGEENMQD